MVQSLSKPQSLIPQTPISQTPISRSPRITQPDSTWTPLNLPPSRLFGTDGIRGKAGDLLNAPFALQLGFWAGQVLRPLGVTSGIVILGQDSRNSSDMLAMSLSAGLTAAGLEVWNIGLCPTPCVAYLTQVTDAIAGIMISASHNPPEDNGIKFFNSEGTKLSQPAQAQIEAALRGQRSIDRQNNHWGQHHHRRELLQEYVSALHQPLVNTLNLQGMRVVLDLAWGAAVPVAPQVFQDLGAEVICLHNRADGDRINVHCGSTHLASLQAAVQEHNADLGFAFDGDADRVIAVDSEGRPVDGDYILYLWGCTLHQAQKLPHQTIISTVMANLGFERAWEKLGGNLVRTPVGDRHVHAEMVKSGAMLGGEQSGHILCHHYSLTGDGVQTALHIAAIVRHSGTSLADLVNQSFQPYPQLLHNVRVEDRHTRLNWHTCQPLQDAISDATESLGNQGRILVRASGTEPVVRVMVEAIQDSLALHWTEHLVNAVQDHLA